MLDLVGEDGGESAEGLAQGHGHGVLELGAAHLDDGLELLALGAQGGDELLKLLDQALVRVVHADVDGGGVCVVGGLGAVDVVVGGAELVLAALVAHDLEGAVGDYLVGVHVGGGAGAALDHIYGEVLVVHAFADFLAGLHDGVLLGVREEAELVVGDGCAFLGDGQAGDEQRVLVEVELADLEVLDATERLHAVEGARGDVAGAEQVALLTIVSRIAFHSI